MNSKVDDLLGIESNNVTTKDPSRICVGLFGTCGTTTWRNDIIPELKKQDIDYFNPQKADWCDDDAMIEATHLINDDIILFPVTGDTYGTGSLAETGYSIMQALRSNENRYVIVYIEPTLDAKLKADDPVAAKESMRSRILVREHLKKVNDSNVFIVDSMQEMYDVCLKISQAAQLLLEVKNRNNPAFKKETPKHTVSAVSPTSTVPEMQFSL